MTGTTFAVIVLASGAGALVKGVTGMGYPVLAVPLIALVADMETAVVVVALPNLAANAYLCWHARDHRHEARTLGRLVGWGTVGAVIGTLALVHLPDAPLRIALAAVILGFVAQFVRRPHLHIGEAAGRRWSPAVGTVAGLMQGAVGVSGPVVATWMHGYRLSRDAFVFAVTVVFGVTGAVQIVVLAVQGRFDADLLLQASVASVAVAVMIPVGIRLRRELDVEAFQKAVLAVLAVSAVFLVADVFV